MSLKAPLVKTSPRAESTGRQSARDHDWQDLHAAGGRAAVINPIKLKAMAMKLRHRLHHLEFKRPTSKSELLPEEGPEDEAQPRLPAKHRTYSVLYIKGPDNVAGVKTIFYHPFSFLLLACPAGILAHILDWGVGAVFWLNFLALVPLAKILGDSTEELAGSIHNDTVTGLLNATFGNAVEMIVAIQSIRSNLLQIVKASLLGSVLSNTLLGTAFLLGGLTRSRKRRGRYHSFHIISEEFEKNGPTRLEKEQKFAVKSALISMAMLMFSCMSFALPTIFNSYPSDDSKSVLKVSRIGAVIVLSSYVAYLIFQLLTHERTLGDEEDALSPGLEDEPEDPEEHEDDAGPGLTAGCATLLMALCTLFVAINSEYLVDTIAQVVRDYGLPESFIDASCNPKRIETRLLSNRHLAMGNACLHFDEDEEEVTQEKLVEAVENMDADEVERILESGLSEIINQSINERGQTILDKFAIEHAAMLKEALHHKDSAGHSTRHLVEMQESAAQTLRVLLEHGAVLSAGRKPP